MRTFLDLLKLLRPKQWIKNSLVFIPLLFRGLALDPMSFFNACVAFALFCITASAVYVLNDLMDLECDRQHPVKSSERPIASGAVSKKQALIVLGILYAIILFQTWFFPDVLEILLIYMVLNTLYTFIFKQQPIIDMFILAIGFVLRVIAGAVAISVQTSSLMLITTLCLALYMAAIKRRQEILVCNIYNKGSQTRGVLQKYNRALLDRYAEISGVSAFFFYSMYVFLRQPDLVYSIPLVMFGLFRYWYVVENEYGGESPTDLVLSDSQLLIAIITWIGVCAWVML